MGRYTKHLVRRGLRPTYIDAQKRTLRRLQRFLSPRDLVEAQYCDLCDFLDSHDQSPASAANEISHLKAFYSWCLEEEVIRDDPSIKLKKPKTRRLLPRPIPDDLIRLALADPPADVAPILYLALYAGLRACEIAQLRADDIKDGTIFINESKGGGMSSVLLAPQVGRAG